MKFKKSRLLLLIASFTLLGANSIFANDINLSSSKIIETNENESFNKELERLSKKYNSIEFFDLEEAKKQKLINSSINSTLKFENFEEFEKFLQDVENRQKNKEYINIKVNTNEDIKTRSQTYNGTNSGKQWVPFAGNYVLNGPFCWMNADISYKYKYDSRNNPYFVDEGTQIVSYASGIGNLGTWTQTTNVANVSRSYIDITDKGYWTLGVEIGGFTVGTRVSDTFYWNVRFA